MHFYVSVARNDEENAFFTPIFIYQSIQTEVFLDTVRCTETPATLWTSIGMVCFLSQNRYHTHLTWNRLQVLKIRSEFRYFVVLWIPCFTTADRCRREAHSTIAQCKGFEGVGGSGFNLSCCEGPVYPASSFFSRLYIILLRRNFYSARPCRRESSKVVHFFLKDDTLVEFLTSAGTLLKIFGPET